jgi:uncharacterized protein (DUF1778 family)
MEFILNHAEDVVSSDSYDNLDESPTLRKEVMVALSKRSQVTNESVKRRMKRRSHNPKTRTKFLINQGDRCE